MAWAACSAAAALGGRRAGLGPLLLGGWREGLQGQLPRVFQFGGNMPMRWIDVVELALK